MVYLVYGVLNFINFLNPFKPQLSLAKAELEKLIQKRDGFLLFLIHHLAIYLGGPDIGMTDEFADRI